MEKCIGFYVCGLVCHARFIYVRGADNPPDDPVSPGERYGFIYEINMLRCIFCAMCVEACPTEAITMTHLFEMSTTSRDDAIYTKDELLVAWDGTPHHPDPPNRLIDLEELKLGSGWMRATSPSGRADFEGVVAWTPSATQGELPAEMGQSSDVAGRSSLQSGELPSDLAGSLETISHSSEPQNGEEVATDPPGSSDHGGSA